MYCTFIWTMGFILLSSMTSANAYRYIVDLHQPYEQNERHSYPHSFRPDAHSFQKKQNRERLNREIQLQKKYEQEKLEKQQAENLHRQENQNTWLEWGQHIR